MRAGWWRFWRKSGIEVDISTLAHLPIYKMVNREDPFDKWCPPSIKLDQKYESIVKLGVWGYQIYTYNRLVKARFGVECARLALAHQINALNRVEQMGEEFRRLLDLVEEGVNSKPMKARTDHGEVIIPVEMNVALWLLTRIESSPYFVRLDQSSLNCAPKIRDEIDWHFAECLAFGKNEALRAFSPLMASLNLTQASAPGLRGPAPKEE